MLIIDERIAPEQFSHLQEMCTVLGYIKGINILAIGQDTVCTVFLTASL